MKYEVFVATDETLRMLNVKSIFKREKCTYYLLQQEIDILLIMILLILILFLDLSLSKALSVMIYK